MKVKIYALTDPATGAVRYVGQTQGDLAKRMKEHLCAARTGKQTYCARWYRSVLASGSKPLILLLEETDDGDTREKFWIAHYLAQGARLTNIREGGGGRFLGPPPLVSEATRAKLRAVHLGKKKSAEARANMRKPKSAAARANMAAAQRGKKRPPVTAETRAKLSAANKGQVRSPEVCAKIGLAHKGRVKGPMAPEIRAKISAAEKGKMPSNLSLLHSPEVRAKAVITLRANPSRAKLKPEQVLAMRNLYATTNVTGSILCTQFKLSPTQVSNILRGKTWSWVGGPLATSAVIRSRATAACTGQKRGAPSEATRQKMSAARKGKPQPAHVVAAMVAANKGRKHTPEHKAAYMAAREGKNANAVLTPEQVRDARRRHAEAGTSFVALAREMNCEPCTMRRAVLGITYQWVK